MGGLRAEGDGQPAAAEEGRPNDKIVHVSSHGGHACPCGSSLETSAKRSNGQVSASDGNASSP